MEKIKPRCIAFLHNKYNTILRFNYPRYPTLSFYSSLISQRAYTSSPPPLSLETFDNQSNRKESFPGIARDDNFLSSNNNLERRAAIRNLSSAESRSADFNGVISFATVIQLKNKLSRKRSSSFEDVGGEGGGERPSFGKGYLGLIRNAVIEFNVRIEYFRLQRAERERSEGGGWGGGSAKGESGGSKEKRTQRERGRAV